MKKSTTLLLSFIFLVLLNLNVYSSSIKSIDVTIPKYNIKINGDLINNQKSKNPLFVYKGITYLPMSWEYTSALGLATTWDEEKRFFVDKTDSKASKINHDLTGNNNTNATYKGQLPHFNITVNGKKIDNNQEDYPLFVFRGITYFPMTWKYTYEEFKWETTWDDTTGLSIITSMPESKSISWYDSDLDITEIEDAYINLNFDCWKGNIQAISYNIYRATLGTGFEKVGVESAVKNGKRYLWYNYKDQGLNPSTTYFYQIGVVTSEGKEYFSEVVNATTNVDLETEFKQNNNVPLKIMGIEMGFNSIGIPQPNISIKNLSLKDIDALEVKILCYDTYGRPVKKLGYGNNVFYGIAQNQKLSSGETKWFVWTLNLYENTTKVNVEVISAHFTDGTVWKK